MTAFLGFLLLLAALVILTVRELHTDGLGYRRPPRGPGEDWTAGKLPSHPYGL